MSVDILKLKTLAETAKRNQYDCLALNDYGTAVSPAVALELITEIERHRQVEAEGCKPDLISLIHPDDMAAITKWHSEFLQLTDYGWPDDASSLQDKAYTLGRIRGRDDWAAHQLQATPTALLLAMENLAVKASVADHPPVFLPASARQVPLLMLGGVCLRVSYSGLKWYHDQLIEDRWEPLSADEFEALLSDALHGSQGCNP